MKPIFRALFSLVILTGAAQAGSGARVSGDPIIHAQWAAQLMKRPAVHGNVAPIDLRGGHHTGALVRVVIPQRIRRAAPVVVAAPAAPRAQVVKPRGLDPAYLPAVVEFTTRESPGTIVIDTRTRHLYYVLEGGKAQRYGVGVGRDGFGWSGTVKVGRKAEWPTWTPPAAMRKRQPYLPVSMKGGPENPLGARALYLYKGGKDTLFRIHGSNEPWTIGQRVSSGCFRMRNEDVIALYKKVGVGTKVVVR
jgi:lipoprotein-anchoring transpeptidase ErfK/SrfK